MKTFLLFPHTFARAYIRVRPRESWAYFLKGSSRPNAKIGAASKHECQRETARVSVCEGERVCARVRETIHHA